MFLHRSPRAMRSTFLSRLVLAGLLSLGSALAPAQATSLAQTLTSQPSTQPGQAATQLPTGAWLLSGGGQAASLINLTGAPTPLASQPVVPRQGHSATLLPDGSVLILGGLNAQGQLVSQAERYDPATQAFTPYPAPGLMARAWHSATVLADGRVLITGGQGANAQAIAHAELYNPSTGQAEAIHALLEPTRWRHIAALLPSSQVLLWGGQGSTGPLTSASLFDPQAQRFTPTDATQASQLAASLNDARPPSVLGTEPAADSPDVAPDARLVVRLSQRMAVETLNSQNVVLTGPTGPVGLRVTPVERGLLVFIQPTQHLSPGTRYTLMISGATDAAGQSLPFAAIGFNTRQLNPGATSTSSSSNTDATATGSDTSAISRPRPRRAQRNPDTPRQPVQQSWRDDDGEQEAWTPGQANRKGNWRTGRRRSAAQDLPPLQAPTGVTALAGQALTLHGRPLAGVTLSVADQTTQTDRSGRFLLQNLPAGQHVLAIDATSANRARATYGYYEAQVHIQAGETTALNYTIWMAKLDQANAVELPSPTEQETVLTSPYIPGLEVRMPAGTVLRGKDGQIVTRVTLTPIPVDRPPFPLPEGVDVPVYFTVQPGATRIENIHPNAAHAGGTRLIYPNFTRQPPGSRVLFWDHDPQGKGWYVYGGGKVSGDGKQSIPDPGVAIYQFTGAMIAQPETAPEEGPPEGGACGLDPVDFYTGLFLHQRTDLVLHDVLPIELSRTYRQRDARVRAFGLGTSLDLDMYLVGDVSPWTYQELVRGDGSRLRFARTSPGTGYTDAVYTHTASAGQYHGAVIEKGGSNCYWRLRLRDGSSMCFPQSMGSTSSRAAAATSLSDANGNTLVYTRDGAGNLTRITSPNGHTVDLSYTSNRITQATDSAGRSVSYQYDSLGRLTKATNAEGGSETYTYDSRHNLLTVVDARGHTMVRNVYDANDRVIRQTYADGSTADLSYTLVDGKVSQTETTDALGVRTRYEFEGAYPHRITEGQGSPGQQLTQTTRDASTTQISQSIDALGRVTNLEYNADGEVAQLTRLPGTPSASSVQYTYDTVFKNQPKTITNPLGHTTTYTYDSKGNVSRITNPLGHSTELAYDGQGNVTRITNALGHATTLSYNAGALSSVTDPLGRTTQMAHNGYGAPSSITNPLGQRSALLRDDLGRLTSQVDPLGQTTQISWDANGNPTQVTTPKGGTYSTSYDALNRPSGSTDPLGRSDSAEYDGNGNLTRSTDRKGQVTQRAYDALNRLTQITFADGSTIHYTWDAGNRVTRIVDSINGSFDYSYDQNDRLTQEVGPKGTVTYTHDLAGRRTGMQVSGQPAISYSYDAANRLTSITQAAGNSNGNQTQTTTYTWDAANRLTSKTLPNGITATYTWDAAGQLLEIGYAKGGNSLGNLTYTYDQGGRRTSIGGTLANPQPRSNANQAQYDAANQLTNLNAQAIEYDANGNMTSDGSGNSYTWDARNQLTGISGPGGAASFTYDPMGRRSGKTINGVSTGFVYDGLNLVQEQGAGNEVIANLLTGLGIDETVARFPVSGNTEVMITDALGSTIALTNLAGSVTTSYAYDTYGATTQSGAPSSNPIQYTGRENDGINGLYYYRARYYATGAQRFISEDPIGLAGGINTHGYVEGDPVSYVDPYGRRRVAPNMRPTPRGGGGWGSGRWYPEIGPSTREVSRSDGRLPNGPPRISRDRHAESTLQMCGNMSLPQSAINTTPGDDPGINTWPLPLPQVNDFLK